MIVNPEKNLIIASASNGTVYCYNVDYSTQGDNVNIFVIQSFSLLMVDRAPIEEFSLQKKPKIEGANEEDHRVKLALSKVLNETYLAISFESQCTYFRNYMKRIVIFYIT